MPNKIVKLTEKNLLTTIQNNFGKLILVLFTERKESSLLYRSLANIYSNQVVFSEIHKNDPFAKKFKIDKYPTLMMLTDPTNYKGVIFEE